MPAEWEPHRATWISWPHHEPDWPGKLGPIPWVYAEIVRVLAAHEPVEILCHDDDGAGRRARRAARARRRARIASACTSCPTDRVWLRDSAPTGVLDEAGRVVLVELGVQRLGEVRQLTRTTRRRPRDRARSPGLPRDRADAPDGGERVVLEGGGIDVNGDGLLLVTEEWLLSDVQVRNPGLTRADYERVFAEWLGRHADDLAGRRAASATTRTATSTTSRGSSAPDTVVLAVEDGPGRRQPRALHRQPAAARAGGGRSQSAAPRRDAALSAAGRR